MCFLFYPPIHFFFATSLNTTLQFIFIDPIYLSHNFVAILKIWKKNCFMRYDVFTFIVGFLFWYLIETNTFNKHLIITTIIFSLFFSFEPFSASTYSSYWYIIIKSQLNIKSSLELTTTVNTIVVVVIWELNYQEWSPCFPQFRCI